MIKRTEEELKILQDKIENYAPRIAKEWEESRLSSSKMRKFYAEFKRLERIWINGGKTRERFNEVLPMIKFVSSKVAYDSQRSGNKMPMPVGNFFRDEIKNIKNEKDFDTFLIYLEAIVGFANLKN